MQLIVFDDSSLNLFRPLTLTRSLGQATIGKYTVLERYLHVLNLKEGFISTTESLQKLYETPKDGESLWINSRVVPTEQFIEQINNLPTKTALIQNEQILAVKTSHAQFNSWEYTISVEGHVLLNNITDVFRFAGDFIAFDFAHHTVTRPSLASYQLLFGDFERLSISSSAKLLNCTLNTTDGPIIIDSGAEIQEGVHLRGPLYIGKNAQVKMGARISGPTSIGEECRIGGEVVNCVILPFSNKGHDGFLGNAVLGSWVNLGADTNGSNLKNNYSEISIQLEFEEHNIQTGLLFCGPLIGDHSKTGINTMLNTATYIGVASNVFGSDFPEKYIPSFSWKDSLTPHQFEKAIQTAERMMARRGKKMSEVEKEVLKHIYLSRVS
ncbi:MAG: glucose-1-phosphate thymidylyltransferase [Bacteroidetes bacterium]|nr:glucose-1-phosphate thymidylyltransferase [Bacteroidota bacterium]